MKKKIIAMLLTVATMLSLLCVPTMADAVSGYEAEEKLIATMLEVAENDTYTMYADFSTGKFALKNKITGEIYTSNPTSVDEKTLAPNTAAEYNSQLVFGFTNIASNSSANYYSAKDSSSITVSFAENGIRVQYAFGGEGNKNSVIPQQIRKSSLDAIIAKVEENKDTIKKQITSNNKNPVKNIENVYVEKMTDTNDITYLLEDSYNKYMEASVLRMLNERLKDEQGDEDNKIYITSVPNAYLEQVLTIIGYTKEDQEAEYEAIRQLTKGTSTVGQTEEDESAYFEFTVTYTLNEDGFSADIDCDKTVYDSDTYYITYVSVLPYFCAAEKTDKGYNFLPDGSGALKRFEDRVNNSDVEGALYGLDYAYYSVSVKNSEQYTVPVFGLVNNSKGKGQGFFAIIEEGDALSSIFSRHTSEYNSIYAKVKMTDVDKVNLAESSSSAGASNSEMTIRSADIYRGNFKIRYAFLTSSQTANDNGIETFYDTSYVGMAQYYRNYLLANGTLTKLSDSVTQTDSKLFLEVFGSIKAEERVLTFPVTVDKELTTFDDVKEIYDTLANVGITNTNFILTGFTDGGLSPKYPTKIKWLKKLGGEDGFTDLLAYAEKNGFDVSPNVDFAYSRGLYTGSGFQYKKTATRTLDDRYTTKRSYNASTQLFERTKSVAISTGSYALAFAKFYQSAVKYDLTSLAVRTLGSDLNSDFDKEDAINRQESLENTVNLLKTLSQDHSYDLILDQGNLYSLKYAKAVLQSSLDSSRLQEESESVPFLGMVLHASVEFTGNALNTEGDTEYMFLKALESGATLYYTLAKRNIEYLKADEEYNKYYSVSFDTLVLGENKNGADGEVVKTYQKYNAVMKSKQSSFIVDHVIMNAEYGYDVKRIEDGEALNNSRVTKVLYENGEGFILNYNNYDVYVKAQDVNITTENVTVVGDYIVIPAISFVSYTVD